jgi:anti-sigma regulatory factor (Ser/Thr protein kinase)
VITGGYVAAAGLWIAASDYVLSAREPGSRALALAELVKGELFVVVTGAVLFAVLNRYLSMISAAEERYRVSQEALRQQERAVRQGYVDVLDAVTGGKLILLTAEEMEQQLGEPLLGLRRIGAMRDMVHARADVRAAVQTIGVTSLDALIVAFGEALTNALKHAGAAEYGVATAGERLQVIVRDEGRGIDFRQLPKAALVQGYSTTNSLGFGFTIMLDIADRVLLCTGESGTTIVLEVDTDSRIRAGAPERAAPGRTLQDSQDRGATAAPRA